MIRNTSGVIFAVGFVVENIVEALNNMSKRAGVYHYASSHPWHEPRPVGRT